MEGKKKALLLEQLDQLSIQTKVQILSKINYYLLLKKNKNKQKEDNIRFIIIIVL